MSVVGYKFLLRDCFTAVFYMQQLNNVEFFLV